MDVERLSFLELSQRVTHEHVGPGVESQVSQVEPPARHARIRRTDDIHGSSDWNRVTARSSCA